MSKRKINPRHKKSLSGITNSRFLNKIDSDKIAVKLSTEFYKDRFFPGFLEAESLDSVSGDNIKYHHLGFQFVFKNTDRKFLEQIEIYWVIYIRNYTESIPTSAFCRLRMRNNYGENIHQLLEIDPIEWINLEISKFYSIEQYKTFTETHSHYDIASQPIEANDGKYAFDPTNGGAYKHLDFFGNNQNIDFVYFTCDQIRHFFKYYNNLIISGSQVVFGKQLSHYDDEVQKNYIDNYFTLKIEGEGYKGTLEFRTNPNNPNGEATYGTEVATGQPCPPRWRSFSTILEQLNRIYDISTEEVKKLSISWNSNKYEERM